MSSPNSAIYWPNNQLLPPIDLPDPKNNRRRSRPARRTRHCSRPTCPIQSAASLDELPWISLLDTTPDFSDLSDIADLSALDAHGPGPIRRRKTSLHSTSPDRLLLDELRVATPFLQTPPSRRPKSSPIFRHLMPVHQYDQH